VQTHTFFERFTMRLLFAWLVLRATPDRLYYVEIPSPNGLARMIDLHFLLDPRVFTVCHTLLIIALVLYVLRLFLWLALPVALFINVATNAIVNSQGAVQHAFQIVSLVLLAQTAAHFHGLWRRRQGEQPALLEERLIWWSQQTIVAVYLVAGLTKLIVTKGLWIFQARFIAVSVAKAGYQSFHNNLNSAELQRHLAVADFAAAHGWIMALIAALGLLLELGAPVMLLKRGLAAVFGSALLVFHLGLDRTMSLGFIYNQWLLIIYLINIPYWITVAVRNIRGRFAVTSP
jgi:hypothetical protein